MEKSIKNLKTLLTNEENLSKKQLTAIKGGCGNPNDPRRCKDSNN